MKMADDFRDCFQNGKRSVAEHARVYLSGLLNQAPRKNMERMEEYVEGCAYESAQYFLSESRWDHRKVLDRSALDVSRLLGTEDTALIIDESGLAKKGIMSVGVARQYNGRLGKVDNCQVGVFAALSNGKHAALVDARLYLPKEWTDDPARCQRAKIPADECTPRSKLLLAAEMILRAMELRLGFGWICMDAFYGASSALLRQIEQWGLLFVADVRANQPVRRSDEASAKNQRIDDLFFGDIENDWEVIELKYQHGIKRLNACRQRVFFPDPDGTASRVGWAVCTTDPASGVCTYFVSNCDVSLAELVRRQTRRYWIERAFQDAKTSLGMADYQARGWLAWHHHMAMVALAQRFVLAEQTQSCRQLALLSPQDIIQALTVLIPRKDTTLEQVLDIIDRRHKKRRSVRIHKNKMIAGNKLWI
jgi:SRSO17 transposase